MMRAVTHSTLEGSMMKTVYKSLLLCFAALATTAGNASEVLTLTWKDLVPEDQQEMIQQASVQFVSDHSGEAPEQNKIGSFQTDLAGKTVRIPGFVIPLEGDNEKTTQFLLVPYYGACIHVPPPPINQIVFVEVPEGTANQGLWDVVYVTGTLSIEDKSTDIADSGYVLQDIKVEQYEDQ
ncbi:DUF3299 domain-containing protein [Vibrio wakamikoensis]